MTQSEDLCAKRGRLRARARARTALALGAGESADGLAARVAAAAGVERSAVTVVAVDAPAGRRRLAAGSV